MRGAARRFSVVLVVVALAPVLVGCGGRAGGSGASAPGGAGPPKQPFGERCVAQPSQSRDGMLVTCDDGRVRFIVPGTDWNLEPSPASSVIVFASSGPLNLSVRVADEGESRYEVHEHLEAILRGVSEGLTEQGHQVSSPRFEETKGGRIVLSYDVAVAADDGGEALRMVNAWTAAQGADGRYLDYHVSFTASVDDPVWKTAPPKASPRERVNDLAGAFSLTGADKPPP